MKVSLNKLQEQELINLYLKGSSTKELCIKYGWSLNNRHGPLDILKKNNIFIRKDNETHNIKYTINNVYFEKINSIDKAYFLGLIYADGSIHYKKAEMKLPLQEKDKIILDKFNYYINSNKPLRINKAKIKNRSNMYSFVIENRKIIEDLKKLGVLPNKESNIKFPYFLKEKYISHFIRGFFDGDGSIYKQGSSLVFNFTGTHNMINSINELLSKKFSIELRKIYKRHKDRDHNMGYQISWYGKKISKLFYDWIYKDCNDLYINRKKEKFEELL